MNHTILVRTTGAWQIAERWQPDAFASSVPACYLVTGRAFLDIEYGGSADKCLAGALAMWRTTARKPQVTP